jgi:uncharacterized protein
VTDMTDTWSRGLLHELAQDECLRLLESRRVGRLAFVDDEGPAVIPVNYVSYQGAVLFTISPHSSIGRHIRGQVVGLEVDDIDEGARSGWSVLLRGIASFVDYDELPAQAEARPDPWPEGVRSLHVRVTRRLLTGRRLLPG